MTEGEAQANPSDITRFEKRESTDVTAGELIDGFIVGPVKDFTREFSHQLEKTRFHRI